MVWLSYITKNFTLKNSVFEIPLLGSEYSRLYLGVRWLKMTTGLVLIAAILVLGGVIATVGDRLGMRVGKARLTLFRLRPRQTATLITILTGIIISASTFGILFAIDDQLRTGVFELEEIQDDLTSARQELEQARRERSQTRTDLRQALSEQKTAQRRLQQINRSLRNAIAQQERTETQLNRTRNQLGQVQTNYRQARTLLRSVSQQASSLRAEIQQLQRDRQQQIAERDREIAEREEQIQQRDQAIAEREDQLEELENQRTFLLQAVQELEREFQILRQGNVALLRNQVLASGVVRIVTPSAAPQAVDQILREANRTAIQNILPGTTIADEQIIQITTAQVEQLTNQIQDGKDYVIRILSAGNYVIGEPCVLAREACIQVFASAALNQLIFRDGEIVASTPVNPTNMSDERLVERINLVIAAAKFRARQAGILDDDIQISDDRVETIINFYERLKQYNQAVDIQAIAIGDTYTAGPLKLELLASQDGQVIFGTTSN